MPASLSKTEDEDIQVKNTLLPNPDEKPSSLRLDPVEEKELVEKAKDLKASANALFTTSSYSEAITGYSQAIETLPTYLDYELAVLKSNIAACHVKLSQWKEAIESATEALDLLERVDPVLPSKTEGEKETGDSGVVQEVDDQTEERIEALQQSGKSLDDVRKIRVKALMRRAKARCELGTWSHLQGAQEDYTALSDMSILSALDRKTVLSALVALPPRLETARQQEMADMMGKLKQLGNGILKPFGLSTDNFTMVKDETTGGYSMGFNQGGK